MLDFIKGFAEESGNDLAYYVAPVSGSEVADERGEQVNLLCDANASAVSIRQEAGRLHTGRGSHCGAHSIWSVGIDDRGNHQKCREAVDKPAISFGTTRDWDPADPTAASSKAENPTKLLNTAMPLDDDECLPCAWPPMCVGACPYRRLFAGRSCAAFRDEPEPYALALHARLVRQRKERGKSEEAQDDSQEQARGRRPQGTALACHIRP